MANYKQQFRDSVNIQGVIKHVPERTTMKILHAQLSGVSSFQTLHDDTSINYQVPTGKEFVILGLHVVHSGGNGTLLMHHDDNIDETGSLFFSSTLGIQLTQTYAMKQTIPTGRYINVKQAGAQIKYLTLYGYEQDE